jgi:tryptophan synthase alpha chain
MNRIDKKFEQLKKDNKKALITFLTVGDPTLEMSEKLVLEMEKQGADVIELGVPFSDPASDGPIIQEADIRALANGVNIYKVFEFTAGIRDKVSVPLVFLLYYNIIVQYGIEKFFKECAASGVDAVIIPDLPYEESGEIAEYTEKYGVYQIQLVSPTSHERIKAISENAKGFLYCVSSMGVTGEKAEFETNFTEFFETIRKYTDLPACIGFGISNAEQVRMLKQYCDGVIVGSAIVGNVARGRTDDEKIEKLREKMTELKSGLAD